MGYQYETLSPETFQQFCQSLLLLYFPHMQCYPVGQPDGGRDALAWRPKQLSKDRDFIVFQVKYNRKPLAEPDPHKWLLGQIRREKLKIKRLIPKGAREYYLITNIPGTSHLDVGSMDELNALLTQIVGIPFSCWWRDDLDRRLDSAWSVKWAYPSLMTGQDMLISILNAGLSERVADRQSAILSYVATQYREDEEVKFKQVELQNKILDLFVDLPISWKIPELNREEMAEAHLPVTKAILNSGLPSASDIAKISRRHVIYSYPHEETLTAAIVLLRFGLSGFASQCVLEGAPGQGKSTIVQYLCQVHRIKLLRKNEELERLPADHRGAAIRLPIKLDLRDYATWLEGNDPFSAREAAIPSDRWSRSLESLIAYQIRHNSGGIEFTVADLHAVARISAVLIVLDGFDEVADVDKRNLIVDEIQKAVSRLETTSASLQVIITSRPAAFANSPGFPEETFPHFELQSLTLPLITEYATKWMDARHLSGRDRRDFTRTLLEKVNQPHMRDLARNPMQLTILLSLIQTRGTSLPDKRTALYDSYMETFFSREAEKSEIVREQRDLLISLHQYLAWILHTEAEGRQNRGSVTRERLEQLVGEYLAREGHNVDLVEQLFVGMVERVVALVSRVQGTFEFEVQPLREYFAARFLNETAPYSPPGAERKGTKPDRFDAVARNFYWLNVTRFFAGCFSKGELASLVDSLEMIFGDKDFNSIGYPRDLAAMLLADWVFAQQPRLVDKVAKLILTEKGLRTLIASAGDRRSSGKLALPEKCGKGLVLDFVFQEIQRYPPPDYLQGLARIAVENSDPGTWCARVTEILNNASPTERAHWLRVAADTGTIRHMDIQDLNNLHAKAPLNGEEMNLLIERGRTDFFEQSKTLFNVALELLLDGAVFHGRVDPTSPLAKIGEILLISGYLAVLDAPATVPFSVVRHHFHPFGFDRDETEAETNLSMIADESQLVEFLEFYGKSSKRPVSDWVRGLDIWNGLIERARNLWGDQWCLFPIASVSTAADIDAATLVGCENLLDAAKPLCSRVSHARLENANYSWWMEQLDLAVDDTEIVLVLSMIFSWADGQVISDLFDRLEEKLNSLAAISWARFYRRLPEMMWISKRRTEKGMMMRIGRDTLPTSLSPRLAASMLFMENRVSDLTIFIRYLSEYDGGDESILTTLQSQAITFARASKTSWKKALEISKSTYKRNIAADVPSLTGKSKEMPLDLRGAFAMSLINTR